MKKLVYHVAHETPVHTKMLKDMERYYEVVVTNNIDDHLAEAEIIVATNVSADQINQAPHLKWIQSQSSGVNQFPLSLIESKNILITSAKGLHAGHMSEYTIMAMLYFSRNMHQLIEAQRDHRWEQATPQSEIEGATVGIIALGEIGKVLAHKCKQLGMNVIANSFSMKKIDEVDQMVDLDTLFKESDYVVSILPYTEDTVGMLDKHYFEMMKADAVFINIGRGVTVIEKDLIECLKNNQIKGACLDVFEVEPLPKESPLWDMNNVMLTPHLSGLSTKYQEKMLKLFSVRFNQFTKGEVVDGTVDFTKGY